MGEVTWAEPVGMMVPSLALCNVIRAPHREAGPSRPVYWHHPTAPHGHRIEGERGRTGWTGSRAAPDTGTQRWGWREALLLVVVCVSPLVPQEGNDASSGRTFWDSYLLVLQLFCVVTEHPAGTVMLSSFQPLSASALWGKSPAGGQRRKMTG